MLVTAEVETPPGPAGHLWGLERRAWRGPVVLGLHGKAETETFQDHFLPTSSFLSHVLAGPCRCALPERDSLLFLTVYFLFNQVASDP